MVKEEECLGEKTKAINSIALEHLMWFGCMVVMACVGMERELGERVSMCCPITSGELVFLVGRCMWVRMTPGRTLHQIVAY